MNPERPRPGEASSRRSTRRPAHLSLVVPVPTPHEQRQNVSLDFSLAAHGRILELADFDGIEPHQLVRKALWLYDTVSRIQTTGGKIYIEEASICYQFEMPFGANCRNPRSKV